MIISNEPGYYKTDSYGIRIENLVMVVNADHQEGMEGDFLEFENLTLAPIDRNLIDGDMLDHSEKQWLDNYHTQTYKQLSPLLQPEVRDWLQDATQPI